MITQTELEELLREHGLAPYVYIKSEKEQFKINLMSHANYIAWRENPQQKALLTKLKNSKSEYLEKEAEAKIIDEDNKTYQIQYKDTIDRVPKSAVK